MTKGNGHIPNGWEEAGQSTAYAKIGGFGQAGSGKTVTGALLAIALARQLGLKQVYMVDTETGADFVEPIFKRYGLRLLVKKTRALKALSDTVDEMGESGEILLVDSITHHWDEFMKAFLAKKGKDRISLPDWGQLKPQWNESWATPFVVSKLHIIVLGRLSDVYDMFLNEKGELESHKTGTKMKVESGFGYEPSVLFEMERAKRELLGGGIRKLKDKKAREKQASAALRSRQFVHLCTIIKDRSQQIMGKEFAFEAPEDGPLTYDAVWEAFQPFFKSINLGGAHTPLDTSSDSTELFSGPAGTPRWKDNDNRRQVALDEIQEHIRKFMPWRDERCKVLKGDVLEALFGSRGWKHVEINVPLEKLEKVLERNNEDLSLVESVASGKADQYLDEKESSTKTP